MNVRKLTIGGMFGLGLLLMGYLILERIPEVDSDPANAPIEKMAMTVVTQLPLTTAVSNPAGIVFLPDTNTYLVSTDDRAVIELSADFAEVISSVTLPNAPLAIGDTEGVTYLGDGHAAILGENGVVVLMKRDGAGWKETDRYPIRGFKIGTQTGSATFNPGTRTIYTAQKKGEKVLYKIDAKSRTVTATPMKLGSSVKERSARAWQEFTISGIQFYKGRIYAISEAYSSLLVVNLEGIVEEVIGLTGGNESSGVTVRDGVLVLIGDAESYLPDPPIYLVHKSVTNR